MHNRHTTISAILCVLCAEVIPCVADDSLRFENDIRPILSNTCYQCHGPDEAARQTDLRLDVKEIALADHDGTRAIVPGDVTASALIERITSSDPDVVMPPPDSGKSLTPQQIELLTTWITQGAEWSTHWAFVLPTKSPLPNVTHTDHVRNPIDRFIVSQLETKGVKPSPPADRATLLRRLSLDLIGLPPTIEELDAVRSDESPDWYQKDVERLLASPHYGERWGRIWLDAARYADSDGYEKDKPREVWFYRDWVVNALNDDMPYDQFIIEQIAGDLLDDATQGQIVATGFLRNSMINEEGGVDPEQFRMEAMFDRMDAIGKGILGLTIQCAQCHTHKFDPLTQTEYYQMFAFINDSHEANIAVYTPDEQMKRAEILGKIKELEEALKHRSPNWPQQMAQWEETVVNNQPEWTVLGELELEDNAGGGQKFLQQSDGSYLAQGYAPTKSRPRFIARTDVTGITAVRLELLNDPNLPLGGPGRSIEGTGALTEFELEAAPLTDAKVGDAKQKKKVEIASATADVNPERQPLKSIYDDKSKTERFTGPIEYAIDGKQETAWSHDVGPVRRNQPRDAVFVLSEPISNEGGSELSIYLTQKHGGWNSDDNQNHNLGRFRLSVTTAENPTADPLPIKVRDILSIPDDERTGAQRAAVFSDWRTTVNDWQDTNRQIEELWRQHPEGSSQLVLDEREKMRTTSVLQRGDFLKPTNAVQPGVPDFLNPLPPDAERDRLTFARWLVDRDSPTAARSIVNRVWQAYFGIGIVETSEDLGSQAAPPSHPQLLDWLAVDFMEHDWSLKHLNRMIVMSATYRQSSDVSPEMARRDPKNRLLARGPRYRVDAELVRDIALAASGLLNREVGGPPVYPPAPEFLFEPPASYGPKNWYTDDDADRYRRALYTFRFRSVPYPVLETFDAPNGDQSCVRRSRSNTPLQALAMLNEPLFIECAQALGTRVLNEGGDDDRARLNYAYRRALSRDADDQEAAVLLDLLNEQRLRFEAGELDAMKVIGEPKQPGFSKKPGFSASDLAAWTALSRVLLSLDETITKE